DFIVLDEPPPGADAAGEAPASRPATIEGPPGGFYISGRVGGAFSQLRGVSARFGGELNNTTPDALAFVSAVEGGFETHRLGAPLRLGVQLASTNFAVFNLDETGGTTTAFTEIDVNSLSLMAVASVDLAGDLQIIDTGPVTPFITGGLGFSANFADVTDTAGGSFDDFTLDLAWMVGAGAALALDDQLSLEARYAYTGRGDVAESAAGDFDPDLRAHEFTVGARYAF
ncbi:MAG: outer membrane beta-barrel protein, partial [Pseudomonadota bacterium]